MVASSFLWCVQVTDHSTGFYRVFLDRFHRRFRPELESWVVYWVLPSFLSRSVAFFRFRFVTEVTQCRLLNDYRVLLFVFFFFLLYRVSNRGRLTFNSNKRTILRSGLEFHWILIRTWSISSLISFGTWFGVVYWVLPSFFYIDVTGFYRVFFPLNENSFSVGTRVSWNFDWNLIDFIVDFVLNLILGGLLGFTEFFFILVLLGFTEFLIEAGGFFLWNERAVLRSGLAFHRILNWQSNCNRLLGFTEFLFGCYWVLPSFLSSSALDCDFGKNGHAKPNSMTDLNL